MDSKRDEFQENKNKCPKQGQCVDNWEPYCQDANVVGQIVIQRTEERYHFQYGYEKDEAIMVCSFLNRRKLGATLEFIALEYHGWPGSNVKETESPKAIAVAAASENYA
jgi:hypothetical protein